MNDFTDNEDELYKDGVSGQDLGLIRQIYGIDTQETFAALVCRSRTTVSTWECLEMIPKKIVLYIEKVTGWKVQKLSKVMQNARKELENPKTENQVA